MHLFVQIIKIMDNFFSLSGDLKELSYMVSNSTFGDKL